MNLLELNRINFAVFEKRVTDPRTDGPTHGRTKPLIELLFATKNLFIVSRVGSPFRGALGNLGVRGPRSLLIPLTPLQTLYSHLLHTLHYFIIYTY